MEALFDEFMVEVKEIRAGVVHQMSEQEIRRFQEANQEFAKRLRQGLEGTKLVQAIYTLVDKLTAQYLQNHQLACKKGCGWCCRQMVCATTLEMQLIVEYLSSLQRKEKSQICRRVRKMAVEFYWQNQRLLNSGRQWQDVGEMLRKISLGQACVFLSSDSSCDIYPVRPIDCRSARSLDRCGEYTGEKPKLRKVKFIFDQIASNLITDEEERANGNRSIVPLIGWPISQQFNWFFNRYKQ